MRVRVRPWKKQCCHIWAMCCLWGWLLLFTFVVFNGGGRRRKQLCVEVCPVLSGKFGDLDCMVRGAVGIKGWNGRSVGLGDSYFGGRIIWG